MRESVGILSVPWMGVPPRGQGSIAGKTHRITEVLADRYRFTIVGGTTGRAPAREHPAIRYVSVADRVDKRLLDPVVGMASRLTGKDRHEYFRVPYHPIYARHAVAALRDASCSTVIVHEFPQWIPAIKRALPDARVILWGGADSFIETDHLLRYVARADALIGASRFLARRFAERVPSLAERTYVVYSGVDVARFRPGRGTRAPQQIVFAGRVTPEKGVHVLVDAFRELADTRPELELVLAGPPWVTRPTLLGDSVPTQLDEVTELARGDYRAELIRRAGDHAGRLVMPGSLGGDDLIASLQQATIFCHPALCKEGFCTVVAEAMACGAPVVVSDLGAPPEFVLHDEAGMVSPAGDARRLAEVLGRLLDDPDHRRRLGRRAEELVRARLSSSACAEALSAVLDGRATPIGELSAAL